MHGQRPLPKRSRMVSSIKNERDLPANDRVKHLMFGSDTVQQIDKGTGGLLVVIVNFRFEDQAR